MVEGDKTAIDTLFKRIERYVTIIAGKEFLKFDKIEPQDYFDENEEEKVVNIQHNRQNSYVSYTDILMRELTSP